MSQTTSRERKLHDLLAGIGVHEPPPDAELHLSSLQVITLVTQIEGAFGLDLTSRDITRKNFRTAGSLLAMLAVKVPS